MTASEHAVVFKLLDDYSRNKHQCFVAEFELDTAETYYPVCFRPTGGTKDSPRFACRYLHIGIIEVTEAAERKELPASVIELLDKELPALGGLV
ncbi:MAG TPA: hypothetical protein VGV68_08720 [Terriglobia bacterium]|nr:hypothetical protein [Terriglobia bacterium]